MKMLDGLINWVFKTMTEIVTLGVSVVVVSAVVFIVMVWIGRCADQHVKAQMREQSTRVSDANR